MFRHSGASAALFTWRGLLEPYLHSTLKRAKKCGAILSARSRFRVRVDTKARSLVQTGSRRLRVPIAAPGILYGIAPDGALYGLDLGEVKFAMARCSLSRPTVGA